MCGFYCKQKTKRKKNDKIFILNEEIEEEKMYKIVSCAGGKGKREREKNIILNKNIMAVL